MRDRAAADRRRRLRPLWVGLTIVILVLVALETVQLFRVIDGQDAIGTDLHYYQFVAQRYVDTGVWFTDRQLSGPYVVQTQVMLAIVGCLVMLIVGDSLARAFAIAGAAGLVRYRSKIDDPKDASVMLACLSVGLASGVGLL